MMTDTREMCAVLSVIVTIHSRTRERTNYLKFLFQDFNIFFYHILELSIDSFSDLFSSNHRSVYIGSN